MVVTKNFIIKVTGVCNLNCSYCYMYNMGDTTFRKKPKVMDCKIAVQTLQRIYGYATRNNLENVTLILHGGEPLLAGIDWTKWFLEEAKRLAPSNLQVEICLQSNGTLLNSKWIDLFKLHNVSFGISIDGPPDIHNRYRVDHEGRGSYNQVRRAIGSLVDLDKAAPTWGVLVVANPVYSGVSIYKHLLELGVHWMDFLWPDYHHDILPPWPTGSLARFYKDLFDVWYNDENPKIKIRWFSHAMKGILSGESKLDALGPHPLTDVVVETDGSIEPLDVIRTCGNGMTRLGLNVITHNIEDIHKTELFQMCVRNQELLPEKCLQCPAYKVCGGGYMPHRWSNNRGFKNSSVHCTELLEVIQHISNTIQNELKEAQIKFHTG
ncbi:TPA: radical SAM protein [Bacillus cereus]